MRVKHIRDCSPTVPAASVLMAARAARKASSPSDTKPDNYQTNAHICRLVERFPCMYSRTHPHYLRKAFVDKAWDEISGEMGESIPDCKERWRNIRTSFARSINVNKVPASANRTKPYYLHEELQFLAQHITPGIPVTRRNYVLETAPLSDAGIREDTSCSLATMKTDEENSQGQQSGAEETGPSTSNGGSPKEQRSKSSANLPLLHLPRLTPRTMPMNLIDVDDDDEGHESADEVLTEPEAPPSKKRQRMSSESGLMPDVQERDREIKPFPVDVGAYESDFDALFLQALLPELKMMDFHQKIFFKHRIYQALVEIFSGCSTNRPDPAQIYGALGIPAVVPVEPVAAPSANNQGTTTSFISAADLSLVRRLSALLSMGFNANVAAAEAAAEAEAAANGVAVHVLPSNDGNVMVPDVAMMAASAMGAFTSAAAMGPSTSAAAMVASRIAEAANGPSTSAAAAAAAAAMGPSTSAAAAMGPSTSRAAMAAYVNSNAGASVVATMPIVVDAPIPASVRGAVTRSGSNLMRVTLVNTPRPLPIDVAAMSQSLKQEALEGQDD